MEFLKSITRERNGPLIQRYPVIRSTRINCPSAFNYPIPLPDIQLTTFHYANHFYERTGEFFGISILLENLFRAPLSWGKSIATLTKKQGKWSVINRRTYYESKAISGLIARILIDIFDSSPGRGEGRGKGGSDRWHACPNDDCSREIGYLHRVIKFLLLSILQFQIRERKVSIEQTPLSNRPCSPPCYLRIAFRRNPFKNLSSTCALSRSWKNRSSKRISSRFLEDYRFLPMIRKKERERESRFPRLIVRQTETKHSTSKLVDRTIQVNLLQLGKGGNHPFEIHFPSQTSGQTRPKVDTSGLIMELLGKYKNFTRFQAGSTDERTCEYRIHWRTWPNSSSKTRVTRDPSFVIFTTMRVE